MCLRRFWHILDLNKIPIPTVFGIPPSIAYMKTSCRMLKKPLSYSKKCDDNFLKRSFWDMAIFVVYCIYFDHKNHILRYFKLKFYRECVIWWYLSNKLSIIKNIDIRPRCGPKRQNATTQQLLINRAEIFYGNSGDNYLSIGDEKSWFLMLL